MVVPGRLLVDVTRLLPDEAVSIEHRPEEGASSVVSGAAEYRLHTYGAEDFPRLPDLEAVVVRFARDALLETIGRSAAPPPGTSRARCSPASSSASRAESS